MNHMHMLGDIVRSLWPGVVVPSMGWCPSRVSPVGFHTCIVCQARSINQKLLQKNHIAHCFVAHARNPGSVDLADRQEILLFSGAAAGMGHLLFVCYELRWQYRKVGP